MSQRSVVKEHIKIDHLAISKHVRDIVLPFFFCKRGMRGVCRKNQREKFGYPFSFTMQGEFYGTVLEKNVSPFFEKPTKLFNKVLIFFDTFSNFQVSICKSYYMWIQHGMFQSDAMIKL